MDYFATTSKASARTADCLIVGIYKRNLLGIAAQDVDRASKGRIKRLAKSGDVSGDLGQAAVLTGIPGVRASRVVVVGLGAKSDFDAARFRKEFKWLGGLTGPLRDLDVYLLELPHYRQMLPAELGQALDPLQRLLEQHQRDEHARVVADLDSERYPRLCREWAVAQVEHWYLADFRGSLTR